MKFKPTIWYLLSGRIKKSIKIMMPEIDTHNLNKKAKKIYKDLLSQVEGISDNNPMSGNITMSFIIIAMWLATEKRITPEQMSKVMEEALANWSIFKLLYSRMDLNTEKGIQSMKKILRRNAKWACQHPEDTNTWDFNFDDNKHQDGFYYHFTYCPIAEFCKQHGCPEITPVLCNLDYLTIAARHAVLHRKHTIATGGTMCDYWIVGDKIKNPR